MRKFFLVLLTTTAFLFTKAQSGSTQVGVGLDLGFPVGSWSDYTTVGWGGSAKLLLGVGTAGHVTFTTGYSVFKPKDAVSGVDAYTYIVPILVGYRHSFSGFYVEPQAGYGIDGSHYKTNGTNDNTSDGAFTWAMGLGYAMTQGLDVGVRYQSAVKDNTSTDLVGVSARWNFSLTGGK